jgi:hypothetical protein
MIDADELENQFGVSDEDLLALDEIRRVPTVDAVPVVRCKECAEFQQKGKYYNGTPFGYCYHWDYEEGSSPNKVDGNDFCSYGKRREDA